MSKYIGFVYMWTNKINNKKYIGSHIGDIDDGYIGSGKHFLNAIKKYGIENFERNILYYEYNDRYNLILKEYNLIEEYNAVENNEFYNSINKMPNHHDILPGDFKYTNAYISKGYIWCNDDISEKRFPKNEVPVGWNKGRLIISKGSKNYIWCNNGDIERTYHKDNIPVGWNKGRLINVKGKNNSFFGKKHTEKSKEKMSQYAKNRTGKNNPASVHIKLNDKQFYSLTEASNFYEIEFKYFYRSFNKFRKYHETELYENCLKESLEILENVKGKSPFTLANELFKERFKNENPQ